MTDDKLTTEDGKAEFEKKVFVFLDDLHKFGFPNMLGAVPLILENFPTVDEKYADELLTKWLLIDNCDYPNSQK